MKQSTVFVYDTMTGEMHPGVLQTSDYPTWGELNYEYDLQVSGMTPEDIEEIANERGIEINSGDEKAVAGDYQFGHVGGVAFVLYYAGMTSDEDDEQRMQDAIADLYDFIRA